MTNTDEEKQQIKSHPRQAGWTYQIFFGIKCSYCTGKMNYVFIYQLQFHGVFVPLYMSTYSGQDMKNMHQSKASQLQQIALQNDFVQSNQNGQNTLKLTVCELCILHFIMPTLKGNNKATTSQICCCLNTLGVHSQTSARKMSDEVENK